jgi:integrase
MPNLKLTTAAVERLKTPEKGQIEYFDVLQPAFGLRISYSGTKSWVVLTRVNGKLVRYTLGRFPAMSLASARSEARAALQKAAAGIDLRQEKKIKEETAAKIRRDTFESRADEFLKKHVDCNLRASTRGEYHRVLKKGHLAAWQNRPISDITKRDIVVLLDKISQKGAQASARTTLAYLRKFMNWCVDREILDQAPTDRVKAPGAAISRDRTLNEWEIPIVWQAIEEHNSVFSDFAKLLLLTGQRRGEVAGLSWDDLSDFDGQSPQWEIPGERTKNGRAHIVPLAPQCVQILTERPRVGPFVFSTNGNTPISGFSKFKRQLDSRIDNRTAHSSEKKIASWRLHDLRRTVITLMNEKLGFPPHIVEAVVNHQSGLAKAGVAGVYNRALYLDERRRALESWSNYVSKLVGAD